MNIFELAKVQVKKEGKLNTAKEMGLILDRAITIRKYLDIKQENIKKNQFKKRV